MLLLQGGALVHSAHNTGPCSFVHCLLRPFLLLEVKGWLVFAGNIEPAADHLSAFLLPKHSRGHALSFSELHTTTFCISCNLNLEGTMFAYIPHRELYWDHKLAADS